VSRRAKAGVDATTLANPSRARARRAFLTRKGVLDEEGDADMKCDLCLQVFSTMKAFIAHDAECPFLLAFNQD